MIVHLVRDSKTRIKDLIVKLVPAPLHIAVAVGSVVAALQASKVVANLSEPPSQTPPELVLESPQKI